MREKEIGVSVRERLKANQKSIGKLFQTRLLCLSEGGGEASFCHHLSGLVYLVAGPFSYIASNNVQKFDVECRRILIHSIVVNLTAI